MADMEGSLEKSKSRERLDLVSIHLRPTHTHIHRAAKKKKEFLMGASNYCFELINFAMTAGSSE